MKNKEQINKSYENFYAKQQSTYVYPTEFVVRTFLANYPELKMQKPLPKSKVLDVGFGDGRNTIFLCQQGYEVSGIEITQGIVEQTNKRLNNLGYTADLRVGRNSKIPFENETFDYILACHSCYYCDDNETFADNMKEYSRVLKRGGVMIASLASKSSYIFKNAKDLADGSMIIKSDPYGNRNGYRLQAFSSTKQAEETLSPWFEKFSFGKAENNYYGIDEQLIWVVCHKK